MITNAIISMTRTGMIVVIIDRLLMRRYFWSPA
jgi:hypothetical protein